MSGDFSKVCIGFINGQAKENGGCWPFPGMKSTPPPNPLEFSEKSNLAMF